MYIRTYYSCSNKTVFEVSGLFIKTANKVQFCYIEHNRLNLKSVQHM